MPVLPSAAIDHISGKAHANLLAKAAKQPVETFTILYYGDREAEAFLGEIDEDTWIERVNGSSFFYEELFEKNGRVVLYDDSRDRKVTIDFKKGLDLTVSDDGVRTAYEVIDFDHGQTPFVPPDAWI